MIQTQIALFIMRQINKLPHKVYSLLGSFIVKILQSQVVFKFHFCEIVPFVVEKKVAALLPRP